LLALLLGGASTLALASAGEAGLDDFANRYPAGSIASVAQADAVLQEAEKARAAIQRRFVEQEQACQPKFLVSSCVEKASEIRRQAIAAIRPVEVEAARFKRQAKVDEHDKVLAERARQEKLSIPHHQQQQEDFEKALAQREAARIKAEQDAAKQAQESEERARANQERIAAHEAKLKRQRAKQAAEAPMRAANIEAFKQKQEAALKRRAERAQERAEQEQEREEKAAQKATARGTSAPTSDKNASAPVKPQASSK
jgi:hypothetical protein